MIIQLTSIQSEELVETSNEDTAQVFNTLFANEQGNIEFLNPVVDGSTAEISLDEAIYSPFLFVDIKRLLDIPFMEGKIKTLLEEVTSLNIIEFGKDDIVTLHCITPSHITRG